MAAVARPPVFSPPQAAPHICAARQRRCAAARAAKEEASTATLPPPAAAATLSPAAAANPADRKYLSLLPPFFSRATRLEEYGPGLWGLVQPLKLVGAAPAAASSPCVLGPLLNCNSVRACSRQIPNASTHAMPQDWAKFDIQLRMVAARLPDGSLLLISPIAPTQEAQRLLAGLGGQVSHIVLPSSSPEHWSVDIGWG